MGCTYSLDRKSPSIVARIVPIDHLTEIRTNPTQIKPNASEKHRLGLRDESIKCNSPTTSAIRDEFGI